MSNPTVESACRNASHAFSALAVLPPDSRAAILDAIAAALDANRDHILQTCSAETALTIDELTPEFARTTGTLRMFAALIRDGSWCRAAIDTKFPSHNEPSAQAEDASPSTSRSPSSSARAEGSLIGPNHDLRSLLIPLGPVAVFGASNFPLAYGVCGGDTASALAAGCPVIVKEHPAHPITGRLLAGIAQQAILATQNPRGECHSDKGHRPVFQTQGGHGGPRALFQSAGTIVVFRGCASKRGDPRLLAGRPSA